MPDTQQDNQGVSNDLFDIISRSAPPSFTIPVLALKAFVPNLTAVFVLGFILAFGVVFRRDKSISWFDRIPIFISCFAWLLIIDEVGADDILNRYFLGNNMDDHTYLIRIVAGGVVVISMLFMGLKLNNDRTHGGDTTAHTARGNV